MINPVIHAYNTHNSTVLNAYKRLRDDIITHSISASTIDALDVIRAYKHELKLNVRTNMCTQITKDIGATGAEHNYTDYLLYEKRSLRKHHRSYATKAEPVEHHKRLSVRRDSALVALLESSTLEYELLKLFDRLA